MASLTQWTWVWASSGRRWKTGRPDVLQSMGSQSQTWLSEWTTTTASSAWSFKIMGSRDFSVGVQGYRVQSLVRELFIDSHMWQLRGFVPPLKDPACCNEDQRSHARQPRPGTARQINNKHWKKSHWASIRISWCWFSLSSGKQDAVLIDSKTFWTRVNLAQIYFPDQ